MIRVSRPLGDVGLTAAQYVGWKRRERCVHAGRSLPDATIIWLAVLNSLSIREVDNVTRLT